MNQASHYLLALYLAERGTVGPVPSGTVADAVERSPAATTEMLQRLEGRGLVSHERYEGTTLTDEGRVRAAELFETYCTLARFFEEVLELADPEREAMRVAGSVSPTVASRVAVTLQHDDERDEATSDEFTPRSRSRSR